MSVSDTFPASGKRVEISVENALRVPDLVVCPQVFDLLVWMEHVGADLASEAGVLRCAALSCQLCLAFLFLQLGKARAQDSDRRLLVRRL